MRLQGQVAFEPFFLHLIGMLCCGALHSANHFAAHHTANWGFPPPFVGGTNVAGTRSSTACFMARGRVTGMRLF